jgi:acyl-coenzyme A synthetase/AMP-(fatty) acid ligase
MYLYLRELEETLVSHPDVAEVCAVGVPGADHEKHARAFVVLRPKAATSEECLRAYVQEHLSHFHEPREIAIVPELPKGPMGVVSRTKLIELSGTTAVAEELSAKIA